MDNKVAYEKAKQRLEDERLKQLKIDQLKEEQEVNKIFNKMVDMSLLEKMRSGVHIRHLIDHDGISFALRMLSITDWQNANIDAMTEAKKCTHVELQAARFSELLMIKILSMAADGMEGIDETTISYMTHASISCLYTKYLDECEKYTPQLDNLDQNIEVIIEQVKKLEIPLRDLSRQALEKMIITLLNKGNI